MKKHFREGVLMGGTLIRVRFNGSLRKRTLLITADQERWLFGERKLTFQGIIKAVNSKQRVEYFDSAKADSIEILMKEADAYGHPVGNP